MRLIAERGFRDRTLLEPELPIGFGQIGRAVLGRDTVQLLDLTEENAATIRPHSIKEEEFRSYFVTPLITKEQVQGIIELFNRERLSADSEWISFLEVLATRVAIAIDNATMFDNLRKSNLELAQAYDATIEGWALALELRDAETQGHAIRVTEMTLHLARALGLPEFKMEHIRRGALLHDIGKLGIPDRILYKEGPLDEEEWEIMRQHPIYAKKMLSHVEYLRPALNIPYCHHEKWDGTGYPQGLVGEEIPEEARVFAVVDVWDALRSDRPYRRAWDEERTLEYIQSQREIQFDPDVVDVFCNVVERLERSA
jgi:putative nucleotidyltransferase with HDIG domain